MPTYGPTAGHVRPRRGHRAVGRPRASATSTSSAGSRSPSLGHAHPAVADAHRRPGAHAAARLEPVRQRAPAASVAATARPAARAAAAQVFFCNSGAEANECAIKLARRWGGHGRHVGGQRLRLVPRPHAHHAARHRPAAEARDVPAAARGLPPRRAGTTSTRSRRRIDDASPRCCSSRCRARAGCNPRPPSTSQAVRALCDEREPLLIVDEVQTGLGRTGRWFGFEHSGVRPDVVTMAKALGNGVPIGACWARADVAAAFEPGDHATTFGGQPLATAAARAVLDVMEREDVPARAARAGARLAERAARALAGRRRRARARPAARRRARPRASTPRRSRRPRSTRAGRQRGHADRAAVRAVAARHRRRDRRGGRHPRRGAATVGATARRP